MDATVLALYLLVGMMFAHIIEDFHLQGIMADMKQRGWWLTNAPQVRYRYDYILVLLLHGFEWAVCVMIPVFACACLGMLELGVKELVILLVMGGLHSVVDHLKCNRRTINLWTDQGIHIIQILIMWAVVLS